VVLPIETDLAASFDLLSARSRAGSDKRAERILTAPQGRPSVSLHAAGSAWGLRRFRSSRAEHPAGRSCRSRSGSEARTSPFLYSQVSTCGRREFLRDGRPRSLQSDTDPGLTVRAYRAYIVFQAPARQKALCTGVRVTRGMSLVAVAGSFAELSEFAGPCARPRESRLCGWSLARADRLETDAPFDALGGVAHMTLGER